MKKKILILILLAIAALSAALLYLARPAQLKNQSVTWGVTFSQKFAELFDGVFWQDTYTAILSDLGVKNLRLIAYWDDIEQSQDMFFFDDLDWQIETAETHDASILLAVGQKLPRWPECHIPLWAQELSTEEYKRELLDYIETTVLRYKNIPAVKAWIIENEPFLPFGECPEFDAAFLDSEIALVKSLDARPVVITDSGELSTWYRAVKRADIFGSTMYRQIQSDRIGIFTYPIPASFFRVKERIVRFFLKEHEKPFIVIELQAEPWLKKQPYETYPEQLNVFNIEHFRKYTDYAIRAGFDEYYLWGAEWWYWMKETKAHPEFWEYARSIIQK